jgi:hypothetical protein
MHNIAYLSDKSYEDKLKIDKNGVLIVINLLIDLKLRCCKVKPKQSEWNNDSAKKIKAKLFPL